MRFSFQAFGIHVLAVACLTGAAAFVPAVYAQSAPLTKPDAPGPQDALLRQMVGTWNVEPRMWMGPKVIELEKDRQVVRLYWTPLTGKRAEEFLAIEYIYTRQRQ